MHIQSVDFKKYALIEQVKKNRTGYKPKISLKKEGVILLNGI